MTSEYSTELPFDKDLLINLFKDLGFELSSNALILDFGCGSGRYVKELREAGYKAFGCDISFKEEANVDTDKLFKDDYVRLIPEKYKLPFEDNTFDVIFSITVFEHVKNYPKTISELSRILKPDGSCLHIFPSKLGLIESHINIPLGSLIQKRWWINLWVRLGIKNGWNDNTTLKQRSKSYYDYLKSSTNYLSRRQLNVYFKEYFEDIRFCEDTFLKYSPRGKYILRFRRVIPFLPYLYSTFRLRVISTRGPRKTM